MSIANQWLLDSIAVLPLSLWIFIGLGLPYALLLLPRRDWEHKALVTSLTFVCGSTLQTLWMFLLGSASLLTSTPILLGLLALTVLGWGSFLIKSQRTQAIAITHHPFTSIEKAIIVGIIACVVGAWLATSYWTFSAYDTLWVYGYQTRLYTLTHEIPSSIGYYPQYIQLQYAFYQIVMGSINDHYARVVILFMHVGSILASYVLGSRLLDNRRVGLLCAAMWAFYPHLGQWAQMGDLEVPTAFLFTLCSALFLIAWFEPDQQVRRRYALIAGLVFGVAMWTKPTSGAFVLGVMLLVAFEFVRVRGNLRSFHPRFEVAFLTGIACIPIGALWYVRNVVYGHRPIDLPPSSWLSLARRSGDLFGWLLLALVIAVVFVAWSQRHTFKRPQWLALIIGVGLVFVGTLPSMPFINPARFDPPDSHIQQLEWFALFLGVAVVAWVLFPFTKGIKQAKVGASLLLALPYFITWFYAYSYHYRLVFAIVPLLILPSAVLLAYFQLPQIRRSTMRLATALVATIVIILGLIPLTSFGTEGSIEYLWDNRYPDDEAKYLKTNSSLMLIAYQLREYQATHKNPIVLVAPGEQQLRFFFPLMTMDNDSVPTQLDDLSEATHYLYGSHAGWRYRDEGIEATDNQIVGALGRTDIMTRTAFHTDATFQYELYELNLDARFDDKFVNVMLQDEVIWGGFAQLLGWENTATEFSGQTVYFNALWKLLTPTATDATFVYELINVATGDVAYTWEDKIAPNPHGYSYGYYGTNLWEMGETILDARAFEIPVEDAALVPSGQQYRLHLRLVDEKGQPIPLQINGADVDLYEFSPIFTNGG